MRSVEWWCNQYSRIDKNGESYDWWGVNRRKWHLLIDQIIAPDPAFIDSYEKIKHFSRHVDMAAVEWIATMREGLRLIESLPKRILLVHYEALVNQPIDILSNILEFCELTPDESLSSYAIKVLCPAAPKTPVNLNPSIQLLFAETMSLLGYDKI